MEINNENELIEIIKDKSLEEIKSYFQEYQITPAKFNYFNNVLIYFIKNEGSLEIIEFLIKQQQKEDHHCLINNTEALFCSIEYTTFYETKFKIAKLLLRYGTKITNKNADSENIIEYLIRMRSLTQAKLSFILNNKKDLSLLTDKVLFELFGNYNYESCIETILNFKFITNKESIINTLIIAKKRIPARDKDGNNPILKAIIKGKVEILRLLEDYAKENNIILEVKN